jgi:hypothetical protein
MQPSTMAEWVIAIGTCVGALIALLTLLVLWRQLKDLSTSIQGSTYQNVINLMIEIDRFFITHPDLKSYFYNGKKLTAADEIESARVTSTAEMLLDFFDNVYHQKALLSEEKFRAYLIYMRTLCGRSEALQNQLDRNSNWYPPKFVHDLQQSYKILPEDKDNDSNLRSLPE